MPPSWWMPVTRSTPSRCGPTTPRRATTGLRCEGASGDRTVPIHASTTTDGIGPCALGVATPVNDTVVGIIKARERRMLA